MKRFLSALLLVVLVVFLVACSSQPVDNTETLPPETVTPESYTPQDLLGAEFNPYAETEFPGNYNVIAASFGKGSQKLEGRNPFNLTIAAEGDMYASVAFIADVVGVTEQEKNERVNEYLEYGHTDFVGEDGVVVVVSQQAPHDSEYKNGACIIEITYNVPDEDLDKYTKLIQDNYNTNALTSIKDYFDITTDYSECSIEVYLQTNETVVAVQYYDDDADVVKQSITEDTQFQWRDWYGHPAANNSYGMVYNTIVFDSRFGPAILILQSTKIINSSLSAYVEPEFSFTKFGFGFDDAGTCGVYEEREPYYKSIAIHRSDWGEHPDGWNIEYMDMVNGYGLRITYHEAEKMYHISLDKDGGASYDYYPETGEHAGHPDSVAEIFNEVFETTGDEFYDKPLAYFEQFVQERFNMSVDELYNLPKE